MSMKNSNETVGIEPAVPQSTAHRVPPHKH